MENVTSADKCMQYKAKKINGSISITKMLKLNAGNYHQLVCIHVNDRNGWNVWTFAVGELHMCGVNSENNHNANDLFYALAKSHAKTKTSVCIH